MDLANPSPPLLTSLCPTCRGSLPGLERRRVAWRLLLNTVLAASVEATRGPKRRAGVDRSGLGDASEGIAGAGRIGRKTGRVPRRNAIVLRIRESVRVGAHVGERP